MVCITAFESCEAIMGMRLSRRGKDSGLRTFMTDRVDNSSYEGAEGGQIGRTSEGLSQNVVF